MKAIILAAGYGTRMKQLTKDLPKCLLQINGEYPLEQLLDNISHVEEITETYIITNNLFYNRLKQYNDWNGKTVYVIPDGTSSNEERLGAIGDLKLLTNIIKDDVLIVASDYIYKFSFKDLYKEFKKTNNSLNVIRYVEDIETMKRSGCVEIDSTGKIIRMVEKPDVPFSQYSAAPVYMYTQEDFKQLNSYEGEFDNIGSFLEHLVNTSVARTFKSNKLFDFGTIESYNKTKRRIEK